MPPRSPHNQLPGAAIVELSRRHKAIRAALAPFYVVDIICSHQLLFLEAADDAGRLAVIARMKRELGRSVLHVLGVESVKHGVFVVALSEASAVGLATVVVGGVLWLVSRTL